MKKCRGKPFDSIILYLENDDTNNLNKIINKNSEEFIHFMHKIGLSVRHSSLTTNYQNSSTTILTLKTTCFKVDFNDNFVKISPLK